MTMAPKYKLTYFPATGLAEPIRMLLVYGGVEFEDYRFKYEEWPELKKSMPFGKVPILEIDGKVLHQSIAIQRYLAKQFKLVGSNDWESLQCDMMVDTMIDLRLQVVALYHEHDEKKKEEMKKVLVNETIPFYSKKFDAEVKKNSGYFVGGKLTWADINIVAIMDFIEAFLKITIMDDGTYPNLKIVKNNVMRVPSIKAWVEKRPKSSM